MPAVLSRVPLEVCPNQAQVARMLRVSDGTLLYASERANSPLNLDWRNAGGQKRLFPSEVLRAAAHFQRRPLTEVAARLVAHAGEAGSDKDRELVKAEVTDWLQRRPSTATSHRGLARATNEFLRLAKELLEPQLYTQVEQETRRGRSSIPNPRHR